MAGWAGHLATGGLALLAAQFRPEAGFGDGIDPGGGDGFCLPRRHGLQQERCPALRQALPQCSQRLAPLALHRRGGFLQGDGQNAIFHVVRQRGVDGGFGAGIHRPTV